jgi:hypothetical protein
MKSQLKGVFMNFKGGGMNTTHEPVAGNWYVNKSGKLFKVRLVSLTKRVVEKIMLEYLDGSITIITNKDWQELRSNFPGANKKSTKAAYKS